MNTPITLSDAILLVLGICAIILLIYMIRAIKAVIPSLKAMQSILEDTQQITGLVSNAAIGVEDTIAAVSETSEDLAELIRNNRKSFAAIVNLINAIAALKRLFAK
ncbi:MAG: hypothetical protein ACTTJ2_05410 [Anaerovoracaceae bacterium]